MLIMVAERPNEYTILICFSLCHYVEVCFDNFVLVDNIFFILLSVGERCPCHIKQQQTRQRYTNISSLITTQITSLNCNVTDIKMMTLI